MPKLKKSETPKILSNRRELVTRLFSKEESPTSVASVGTSVPEKVLVLVAAASVASQAKMNRREYFAALGAAMAFAGCGGEVEAEDDGYEYEFDCWDCDMQFAQNFNPTHYEYYKFKPADYPQIPEKVPVSPQLVQSVIGNFPLIAGMTLKDVVPIADIFNIECNDGVVDISIVDGADQIIVDYCAANSVGLQSVSINGGVIDFDFYGIFLTIKIPDLGSAEAPQLEIVNEYYSDKISILLPLAYEDEFLAGECEQDEGDNNKFDFAVNGDGKMLTTKYNSYSDFEIAVSETANLMDRVKVDGLESVMSVIETFQPNPEIFKYFNDIYIECTGKVLDFDFSGDHPGIEDEFQLIEIFKQLPKDPIVYSVFLKMFGFRYEDTDTLWKDEYEHPVKSLKRGFGDCDDFSVINYFWAYLHGYEPHLTDLSCSDGVGHVFIWFKNEDGKTVVLDNKSCEILADDETIQQYAERTVYGGDDIVDCWVVNPDVKIYFDGW